MFCVCPYKKWMDVIVGFGFGHMRSGPSIRRHQLSGLVSVRAKLIAMAVIEFAKGRRERQTSLIESLWEGVEWMRTPVRLRLSVLPWRIGRSRRYRRSTFRKRFAADGAPIARMPPSPMSRRLPYRHRVFVACVRPRRSNAAFIRYNYSFQRFYPASGSFFAPKNLSRGTRFRFALIGGGSASS